MNLVAGYLTREQRDNGMTLENGMFSGLEKGKAYYYLRWDGKLMEVFLPKVTIETVRHAANQHLEWAKSGVEFRRELVQVPVTTSIS